MGELPIDLLWLKDKRKLTGGNAAAGNIVTSATSGTLQPSAAEYTIEQMQLPHGAESWLTIASVSREDSSLYTCLANNPHGQDETNIQLIVHEPPEAPNAPHSVEVAARSVKLGWQPPFNGNSPVLAYVLEYRPVPSNEDKVLFQHTNDPATISMSGNKVSINSATTSSVTLTTSENGWNNLTIRTGDCFAQLGSLLPATEYEFRLLAENRLGISEAGTVLRLRTEEEAPAGAPTNVRLAALSTRTVRVSWNSPDRPLQNGRLRGYYVGYKLVGAGSASGINGEQSQFVYKTIEATGSQFEPGTVASGFSPTVIEHTVIGNLKRNCKYAIVVQAYNAKGAGPMSEEQQVITAELDPPETPSLRVQSTTAGSVQLAWQPVATDQNPVDGYLLYQRQESSSEWREYSLSTEHTFYTAIGLHCGTR